MTIRYAILGLLSREPLSGYDLKKLIADSDVFYWSGSNNQIYRALVDLHRDGLVTQEVQPQEDRPARKIYTITGAGRDALRAWVLTPPDLPQLRHPALIQLAWGDQVESGALDALLAAYEEEVRVKLLMLQEGARREAQVPVRTGCARWLRDAIAGRLRAFYEHELAWVRELRAELTDFCGE